MMTGEIRGGGLVMISLGARGLASLAGRLLSKRGTTVFRGEPWKTKSSLENMAKWMYGPGTGGQSNNPLRFGATGRWFTRDPRGARLYAGVAEPGRIKKVTLSDKELKIAEKLSEKLHKVEGQRKGYGLIIPKSALPRLETDYLQTLLTNFYKMIGKRGVLKDGGLASILNI
jgi:hypothetical protein